MSKPLWYVHLQGESIGPLSTEHVTLMLQQNRLQFVDYIWSEQFTKWHRISDLDQFAALAPPYPRVSIPHPMQLADGAGSNYVVQEASRVLEQEQENASHRGRPKPNSKSQSKIEHAPKAESIKLSFEPEVARKSETPSKTKSAGEKIEKKMWPKLRKFHRLPPNGEKVSLAEHGYFPILNISEGGLFLKSAQLLTLGLDVRLHLELPGIDKVLEMTGVVIRHGEIDGQKGFAIEFTRLNPAHKRVLNEYLGKRAKEQ